MESRRNSFQQMLGRLRRRRERPNICRVTCDGVAKPKTFAELLATASQASFFCRVVCDGVASVLFFAEFFATASQASCFLQSSLRRRRKLLCKLQETIFRLYCTFNINKTSNPKNIP